VGAHPDDLEVGTGGTMAKTEDTFFYIATLCGTNNGLGFKAEEIEEELYNSMKVLGVKAGEVQNYVSTHLHINEDSIREDLERLRKELCPTRVYLPSFNDYHQDHVTVAVEGARAFRRGKESLYSYETVSEKNFLPNFYTDITDTMNKKIASMKCYKTQAPRSYMNEELWRGMGLVHGMKIGVRYAEAFEVLRGYQ
jgi:LmbE family N-acetylglucosaminyl deacetylase